MSSKKTQSAKAQRKKGGKREKKRSSSATTVAAAPMAISKTIRNATASFSSGAQGITVCHREFFLQLQVTATDEVNGWTIQPTWDTIFPWLTGIARSFERYEFLELEFEYVPRVPTTTTGEIVLVVDPDPEDQVPTSDMGGKTVLLSHRIAATASVWSPLKVRVPTDCLRERGYLFTAHPTAPAIPEPRTTHLGLLNIGTFGCAANTVLGAMYVSYKIRFTLPQLPVPETASGPLGSRVGANVLSSSGQFANADMVGQATRNLTSILSPATLTSGSSAGGVYEAVLKDVTSRLAARVGLDTLASYDPSNSRAYYEGLVTFQFVFRTNAGIWPSDTTIRAQITDGATIRPIASTYFSYSPLVSGANLFGVTFVCNVGPNLFPLDSAFGLQVILESASFTSGNWYGDVSRFYAHFDGNIRYVTLGACRRPQANPRPICLAEQALIASRHNRFMSEMDFRASTLPPTSYVESCSVKGRR
jgi:hypothetical protein